jgi:polyhydroxybutyrate depolymerase
VPSTISKWVGLNSCKAKPIRVLENAGAYCELYAGCADGARVQLCVTEEGGHSWPGGEKPRGNGTPSRAISATDVMWKFFGL